MQRVSDGLAVPKMKQDIFSGLTTSGFGKVDCELTYTPKSIDEIFPSMVEDVDDSFMQIVQVVSLVGNVVRLAIRQLNYLGVSPNFTGDASTGNSGAAEPHNHTITTVACDVSQGYLRNRALYPLRVMYTVA